MKLTQRRIYDCAHKRGKVNRETDKNQLVFDLFKELSELHHAKKLGDIRAFKERYKLLLASANGPQDKNQLYVKLYKSHMAGTIIDEIVDLAMICNTASVILGFQLQEAIIAKHRYNLNRKD